MALDFSNDEVALRVLSGRYGRIGGTSDKSMVTLQQNRESFWLNTMTLFAGRLIRVLSLKHVTA
jgi:hypothetical protein